MGRNRTPTSILDVKGSYLINPGRKRQSEPTTDAPIGNPPTHLSKEEKKIWREIVKRTPPGVLMETDREPFEMFVRLTYQMRTDFAHMKVGEMSQFISLASRFAMTPADRSKVTVEKPPQSKLAEFLAKKAS